MELARRRHQQLQPQTTDGLYLVASPRQRPRRKGCWVIMKDGNPTKVSFSSRPCRKVSPLKVPGASWSTRENAKQLDVAEWVSTVVKDPMVEIDPVTMSYHLQKATRTTPFPWTGSYGASRDIGGFLVALGAALTLASLAMAVHLFMNRKQDQLVEYPSSDDENRLDMTSLLEGLEPRDEFGGVVGVFLQEQAVQHSLAARGNVQVSSSVGVATGVYAVQQAGSTVLSKHPAAEPSFKPTHRSLVAVPEQTEVLQVVPERAEALQTVSEKTEAVQIVPEKTLAVQAVSHKAGLLQPVPQRQQAVQVVPKRSEALQAVPPKSQALQVVQESPNALQVVSERSEALQVVPDKAEALQHVPQREQAVQVVPKKSEALQAVPEKSEALQIVPESPETLQAAPEKFEALQIVPESPEALQAAPEKSEALQTVPERSETLQVAAKKTKELQVVPETPHALQVASDRTAEQLQAPQIVSEKAKVLQVSESSASILPEVPCSPAILVGSSTGQDSDDLSVRTSGNDLDEEEKKNQAIRKVVRAAAPAMAIGAGAISCVHGVDGAFEMVGFAATASLVSFELLWADARREFFSQMKRVTDHKKLKDFLQGRKIVQATEYDAS